jgi:hypothetical protein
MDDETVALIISLQLSDIEEEIQNQKGKGTIPSSSELALECYGNELRKAQMILSDRRMALSIGRAVLDDGAQLSLSQAEEQQAIHDRNLARRAEGHDDLPARNDHLSTALDMAKDVFAQFSHLSIGNSSETRDIYGKLVGVSQSEHDGSSSRTRSVNNTHVQHDCAACLETKSSIDTVQAPCEHYYCRDCIYRLFDDAITDESLFPAKCCRQPIPVSLVADILGPSLIDRTEQKVIENNTPDRTYCADPECATFIPPFPCAGSTLFCPRCGEATCSSCKRKAHEGGCGEDGDTNAVLQMAQEVGWKRCYRCHTLVELNFGCNHIT